MPYSRKYQDYRNKRLREYRWANPEVSLLSLAKARAKRKKVPFSITKEDIKIPKRCPILGIKIMQARGRHSNSKHSPTLDRFIPAKGYVPGNVNVISRAANRIKCDSNVKQVEKLLRWMRVQEAKQKERR